jgi:hypothetical protein
VEEKLERVKKKHVPGKLPHSSRNKCTYIACTLRNSLAAKVKLEGKYDRCGRRRRSGAGRVGEEEGEGGGGEEEEKVDRK